MASFIPMRQEVTVIRAQTDENGDLILDPWGKPIMGEPEMFKCRAREGTEIVEDTQGEQVVSRVSFLLDRLVRVNYADNLEYTNEIGITYTGKPKSIRVTRDFDGKAILTKVFL